MKEQTPVPKPSPTPRILYVAAVLTLIGLALMVWSIFQPTPLPVMLAMSVGQVIGMSAFAIYMWVVIRALRREYRRVKPEQNASDS